MSSEKNTKDLTLSTIAEAHAVLDRMQDAIDETFRRAGPPTPHPDKFGPGPKAPLGDPGQTYTGSDRPCTGPGKCKPGAKCEAPCEECHILGDTCQPEARLHKPDPKPRFKPEFQPDPKPAPTSRGHILKEAHALINGERQDSYGKPEDSFGLIASFWSMYLSNRRKASFVSKFVPGHFVNISPADVCIMMALLKLARHANNPDHRDNLADAAGYIGLAADLSQVPHASE